MTTMESAPREQLLRPMMEERAKLLATQRSVLAADLSEANAELGALMAKWGEQLKSDAAQVDESERALIGYVEMAPQLFDKPQSIEIDGVRFGLRKGKGRLEYRDEDKLIRRIERELTRHQRLQVLKVTKKVLKGPLAKLPATLLKKLGVNLSAAGTEPFISYPKSNLEKLVEWWLKPPAASDDNDKAEG
jgi:hypothetical protein